MPQPAKANASENKDQGMPVGPCVEAEVASVRDWDPGIVGVPGGYRTPTPRRHV